MSSTYSLALLFHLAGFAAYAGAQFVQSRLIKASATTGLAPPVRDAYESMAASAVTRIQLPAMFVSVLSGVVLLILKPGLLKLSAMHVKLTVVVILLVISHLEMFNARRIVRARLRGDEAAEIEARKRRHGAMGLIDMIGVVFILLLVAFRIRG